jgi:hypothetical protein
MLQLLLQQRSGELFLAINPPGVALSRWGLVAGLFVLLFFHLLSAAGWPKLLADELRRRQARTSTSQQHKNDL